MPFIVPFIVPFYCFIMPNVIYDNGKLKMSAGPNYNLRLTFTISRANEAV